MTTGGMAVRRDAEAALNLPPGFRFHPTDDELVEHYLCRKAAGQRLPVPIIADVDLYKLDPWDLPERALFGTREWYFFTPRDRKYPNGSRPNRAAGNGYWKATGADKPVAPRGRTLGIKKALVFYAGKAPRGVKTDWIMHEYRLADAGRAAAAKKGSLRVSRFFSGSFFLNLIRLKLKGDRVRSRSFCPANGFLTRLPLDLCSWMTGCCAACTTRRTSGRRCR
jgi:hypothetical protein